MAIKQDVFGKLDAVAKPGAILASNTSYLSIDEIAAFTTRPADVLGMHFFSPANVMRLCEVVRGAKTAPEVLATALEVAKRIKKVGVVAGNRHGFIGNRMLGGYGYHSQMLMLEGAKVEQVDAALRNFGMPMGPFQMGDLAGLDIGYKSRKGPRSVELRHALGEGRGRAGRDGPARAEDATPASTTTRPAIARRSPRPWSRSW